jgi:sugar (pentulose or hexulose) kinase
LADLTGSKAYERFSGPQIAKIAENKPGAYQNTEVGQLFKHVNLYLLVYSIYFNHIFREYR